MPALAAAAVAAVAVVALLVFLLGPADTDADSVARASAGAPGDVRPPGPSAPVTPDAPAETEIVYSGEAIDPEPDGGAYDETYVADFNVPPASRAPYGLCSNWTARR